MQLVLLLCFFMGQLIVVGCKSNKKREFDEAEKLAKQYCQSCHLFPAPYLLDKKTWVDKVLPAMEPHLRIRTSNRMMDHGNDSTSASTDDGMLSLADWDKIIRYFYTLAPDTLVGENVAIAKNLTQFNYRETSFRDSKPAVTTMVKIDPQKHAVYISDGMEFKLRIFDNNLVYKSEASTHLAVSSISLDTVNGQGIREATLLDMGILSPNDVVSGKMQKLYVDTKLIASTFDLLGIDRLMRPVYLQYDDINKDGVKDYLISEFGNFNGCLSWLKCNKDKTVTRQVIRNMPGAIQTKLVDYNRDGRKDIIVLMTQGDEGIFLYENKSNEIFVAKTLLRFPPVNGSTSFDLADFNHDGYLDIVYTAGDNSDFSRILKPYHGVYIFLNDGKWNFHKEKYFFPINGCFKVLARDFDQDGDVDLATVSFFPDLKNKPEEGFVYLRNEGNLKFLPQTFNQVINGHWLTMDAGDLDGDGDVDLVLGNMSIGPLNIPIENKWKEGPSFILLENSLK
jgi:hypothetical protein